MEQTEVIIRPMAENEADTVADLVRALAQVLARGVVPQMTGAKLRAASDLVDVMVALEGGRLIGACLTLMTYSTFRGSRGLYIVDLFVSAECRGKGVGSALLRAAIAKGKSRGALFVKLEVDVSNTAAGRFYERLGFTRKNEDRLFLLEGGFLEQSDF